MMRRIFIGRRHAIIVDPFHSHSSIVNWPDDGILPTNECHSQFTDSSEVVNTNTIEAGMKIIPPEPSVDLNNEGFEESDILQRKKTGDALSDLLNRIDDPPVVALDGK